MAAGMALAAANVTPQLDTFSDTGRAVGGEKLGVVVRRNRMTLTLNGDTVLRVEDVLTVERLSAKRWQVTTGDGVYGIERLTGDCGCARGGR